MTFMVTFGGVEREATPEEEAEILAAQAAISEQPPPAPPPLTARQLRLGLVMNGLVPDQVEAAIDAIENPQDRAVAKIEWEYATTLDRTHPLIGQVGTALGLTPEQIDTMWEAALSL